MAVTFRERWAVAPSGAIDDRDFGARREMWVIMDEIRGAAREGIWTYDGSETAANEVFFEDGWPPWVNVLTGDRIAGGWSAFGNFGPMSTSPTAASDQYFWRTVESGSIWRTTVYAGGLDSAGQVIGQARGRKFVAFAVQGNADN